ncbi:hypothetical protein GQ457_15G011700 [Hibiscus cannabinus]
MQQTSVVKPEMKKMIMSMTGENSDDLMRLSSSNESPYELEEVTKTPTNAKRKWKIVEATSGIDTKQTILDFESKTECNADGTTENLKFEKYWKNVNNVNVLTFIALLLDPRHKLRYVEWIIRRSYDPSYSYDLCHQIKSTFASTRSSYFNLYVSGHGGKGEIRKLKGTNLRKDYVTEIELNDTSEITAELDRYLGNKCVRDNDSFDILAW